MASQLVAREQALLNIEAERTQWNSQPLCGFSRSDEILIRLWRIRIYAHESIGMRSMKEIGSLAAVSPFVVFVPHRKKSQTLGAPVTISTDTP
jgi:hypothetical protein